MPSPELTNERECRLVSTNPSRNISPFELFGAEKGAATPDTPDMSSRNVPVLSVYQPLRKAAQEIRLLTITASGDEASPIECAMDSMTLAQAPRFLALSYLWGDPRMAHEIWLNGHKFQVTTNLHQALLVLRHRPVVDHVWIDAICIDQSSNDEKSWQVALMGNIYSRAAQVLGWLGPAADDSDAALDLVRRWGEAIERFANRDEVGRLEHSPESMRAAIAAIDNPFDATGFSGLRKLFARPYWSRVWIMQEVALAQDPRVLCGTQEVSYDQLRVCVRIWRLIGRFSIEDIVDVAKHRRSTRPRLSRSLLLASCPSTSFVNSAKKPRPPGSVLLQVCLILWKGGEPRR